VQSENHPLEFLAIEMAPTKSDCEETQSPPPSVSFEHMVDIKIEEDGLSDNQDSGRCGIG
jgi:hypothetical protein